MGKILRIVATVILLVGYTAHSQVWLVSQGATGDSYSSGSGITIDGSNNIDLGGALDAPTIITGTEVNYFELRMSDAGDRSVILRFDAADGLSLRAYSGDDNTGDSSIVLVDSNLVKIALFEAGYERGISIDTTDERGILITDSYSRRGIIANEDYSDTYASRSYTDFAYQITHLGNQDLNASVQSPTPAEHNAVLTYDSTGYTAGTDQFTLTDVVEVAQAAGLKLVAIDTILYSNTTVDTVVTLPVGAVIWDIQVYIETTFDGSGTNLLDVGLIGDTDLFINDFDMESPISSFYGLGAIPYRVPNTKYVIFQYADSGADASTGEAYIYVNYSIH